VQREVEAFEAGYQLHTLFLQGQHVAQVRAYKTHFHTQDHRWFDLAGFEVLQEAAGNLLPVGGFPEQAMGLPCNASSGRSPDPYIVFEAVEFQQNDQS
jgi:hypothetical protein